MNRRSLFKFLGAGLAGIALEQAIPFGRVWSFPSEIIVPKYDLMLACEAIELEAFAKLIPDLVYHESVTFKMFKDAGRVQLSS